MDLPDWVGVYRKDNLRFLVSRDNSKIASIVDNKFYSKELEGEFSHLLFDPRKEINNYFVEIKNRRYKICVFDKQLNKLGCTSEYDILFYSDYNNGNFELLYDDNSDLVEVVLSEN